MVENSGMAEDDERAELEEEHVSRASKLNSRLIYEVIRRDGQDELERPTRSLIWSGVAAGVLIGFCLVGKGIFRAYLPDAPWRPLFEDLGYSLGFLLVILGRMQLFTENTITTVLPMMAKPCWPVCNQVIRLWSIVLVANVIGAIIAAGFLALFPSMPASVVPAMSEIAHHMMEMSPYEAFWRAIPAGLLIAALVWMLPQTGGQEVTLIIIFTWLIGAGDFAHIVAGSVDAVYLLLKGEIGFFHVIFAFFLPVLAGNVIGGTGIFTLMAWGQVREEVSTA